MPFDFSRLVNLIVAYGINGVGAAAVALVGWWAARATERITGRALVSARFDITVGTFLASLARYAVLAVTFVVVLQIIGIQATSLVAVIGAASLAIGLALQGTLTNVAAGVMLLIFRPFQIGDNVEVAGKSGTVKSLNLFMTELASGDNVQILIPNGHVWGAALTNMSAYPTRQISLSFPVTFDTNIEPLCADLRSYLEHDKRILEAPPPTVTPSSLTDKGAILSVQAWTKSEDAGSVNAELVKHILAALQSAMSAATDQLISGSP